MSYDEDDEPDYPYRKYPRAEKHVEPPTTYSRNDIYAVFIAGFLIGAMFGFYRIWPYSVL